MGNLHAEEFSAIWHGDQAREFPLDHRRGHPLALQFLP